MTREKASSKKRGLGRGLNALFEDDETAFPAAGDSSGEAASGGPKHIAGIDQLEPGSLQPRKHMDREGLEELAASIAVHGVLQPILVRPKKGEDNKFEIIAGERRWRAAQKAQLHEVPVIIKTLDDEQALEIGLIENLQREDLNPMEEAQGYQRLLDEFGHTQEKLAFALGKSRSHIANMTRLLDLPESVQTMVRQGKLSAGHARTLITAKNPEELARHIVDKGLSVREAEKLAAEKSGRPAKPKSSAAGKDVDTLALEKEVTNLLGMKVSIDVKGKGGGTLKVSFSSLDQLDEILQRLSQSPARPSSGE